MSDYIAKLKEERLQKIKIRIEINKKMKDDDEKEVLRMRYLRCMKW